MTARSVVPELVHQAKYAGSDTRARVLAAELSQVMAQHPDLSQVEVVVSVPSHSARRFSERLAAAVANVRSLPVADLTDIAAGPVKDTPAEARPGHKFSIGSNDIDGRHVVLIDDVCRTGETLRSAAAFLDSAGAASVCVLVAVRTMRN